MKTVILTFMAGMALMISFGCSTTYNMNRADVTGEGSLVFVRPDHYSILGTRSIRDHLEITYEEFSRTENGCARLKVGVRNRGGQHWYDTRAGRIQIVAMPYFYEKPITAYTTPNGAYFPTDLVKQASGGSGPNQAPIYKGPRKDISIEVGQTAHLTFDVPVQNVSGYQVVFSEK